MKEKKFEILKDLGERFFYLIKVFFSFILRID
jgi:hypothetical protein